MIRVKSKGNFKNTERFLRNTKKLSTLEILHKYGVAGVEALSENTPMNSGIMANSWYYDVSQHGDVYTICWYNSKIQNGTRIAVILDYGHATGNGGYVTGRNFITPAIRPIFDDITKQAWEEIKHA